MSKLVIETVYSRIKELLRQKVPLSREGFRGIVQVLLVVKMKEIDIVSVKEYNHSLTRSNCNISDNDNNDESVLLVEDILMLDYDLVMGSIQLLIGL